MYTGWLYAAETLRINHGADFGLEVDYDAYRRRQIAFLYNRGSGDHSAGEELRQLRARLSPRERLLYALPLATGVALRRLLKGRLSSGPLPDALRRRWRRFLGSDAPGTPSQSVDRDYRTILDAVEEADSPS